MGKRQERDERKREMREITCPGHYVLIAEYQPWKVVKFHRKARPTSYVQAEELRQNARLAKNKSKVKAE